MTDILALVHPVAFGRAARLQNYVQQIRRMAGWDESWHFETAALLSQIGCVAVPQEVLEMAWQGAPLSAEQEAVLHRHPRTGHDLIARIPRLEAIAAMIGGQDRDFVSDKTEDPLPLGARLLRLLIDFDALTSAGRNALEASEAMHKRPGVYDPELLPYLKRLRRPGHDAVVQTLPVENVQVGMLLDEDVANAGGNLVARRGLEITESMRERLRNFAELGTIAAEVRVRLPRELVPELSGA